MVLIVEITAASHPAGSCGRLNHALTATHPVQPSGESATRVRGVTRDIYLCVARSGSQRLIGPVQGAGATRAGCDNQYNNFRLSPSRHG